MVVIVRTDCHQLGEPVGAERGPGAANPAGHQQQQKAAADYTAAQAVAAGLLA
jgi:hypothetical protein